MNLKEKLITALSTVPLIAATTMDGSCAAGCPFYGLSCSAPGRCGRFTDSGDGICDLSQSSITASSNTQSGSSSSSSSDSSTVSGTANSKTSSSTDVQKDSAGSSNPNGDSSNLSSSNSSNDTNASVGTDHGTGIDGSNIPSDGVHYNVLPVSILLIGGYLFTFYLFKKGILTQKKHRRIWNLLVTAGYLGTGVTGVLLIVLINLGVKTVLNPSLIYWHAELAILMVIGTLIHIHLYWKPFKNMFTILFGFKNSKKGKKIVKSENFSK